MCMCMCVRVCVCVHACVCVCTSVCVCATHLRVEANEVSFAHLEEYGVVYQRQVGVH